MPDVTKRSAKCTKHGASTKCSGHGASVMPTGHSANRHAEATTQQQQAISPRHWLEVPVNNLAESEVVAKRKALAKELMKEEASKPIQIRGRMVPQMRALDHLAAPLLKEYASQGCPVDVGRD